MHMHNYENFCEINDYKINNNTIFFLCSPCKSHPLLTPKVCTGLVFFLKLSQVSS